MDDRFLSSSDAIFVELVEEDLNYFIEEYSDTEKSVLLFPPVSSYHRFLIHSTAQSYTQLHSFSVGAGYNRRTTVCLKQDLIRDPKDCSGLMSAQQPPSSRGRGRGKYRAGGSPSPSTTARKPGDTDVRAQEQGSGQDGPKVERHPQSLRNRKKRPEVQLYVPRGRRQQLEADQAKTNEHASEPTVLTNQEVRRPVSYQQTSCPEGSPDVDSKYTSVKFREEKSRNDNKNFGQYSTERNNSSNFSTPEYPQQQSSSRLVDCDPPKQRRAGRGTANRKSRLKNEVYVPPGRRNRDSSGSVSNSSAVDDTKGQFEDVYQKQESEINVEVTASLCSKHSDAKKSKLSRTVRESGLSDSKICNLKENYSDDRGAGLEESSEVSFDKQSTSILSRNIECAANVQSQKCVIPQRMKPHSVDLSPQACTPYDTNSHYCVTLIDNVSQAGASDSGVTHNREPLDKKRTKNTDPLTQDADAVSENSMQVNQLSGEKSASYSENVDKTEMEFKTESQKILNNQENCEEEICDVRTNSVNKSAVENIPESVDDQHTDTPADDALVQDQTETQADDTSVQGHTEIPVGDISVQDHTEIQAGDISMQDHTEIRAGDISVQDSTEVRAGDISVQSHTEIPADDISVQDHTEIRAGDISVQDHTEIRADDISMQDRAEIPAGDISVQSHTEIPADDISMQGHAERPVVENIRVQEGEDSDIDLQIETEINVCISEKNVDDSVRGNIKAAHINKKDSHVDEQGNKVKEGNEKIDDEETTCDKGDDIEEEDDEDSWDKLFDEEGECLDPKAMEELTSAIGKVKIKKPTINYLNYQPRDPDMDYDDMSHVIEIFDFPPEFKTEDLLTAFNHFSAKGIDIKWVDDTHALGVFNSPIAAKDALMLKHPLLKVGPLSNASRQCKVKAKRCVEFLQPYKPRPETSAVTARRLVTGALGLLPKVSKEQRDAERQKLKQARDKKKLVKKQKEDIWEGNYTSAENMG